MAAQVKDNGDQTFQGEFTPKVAGEHRIHVMHEGKPVSGSPFNCKVYDVNAIKIKEATKGVVGKPVTFLGMIISLISRQIRTPDIAAPSYRFEFFVNL